MRTPISYPIPTGQPEDRHTPSNTIQTQQIILRNYMYMLITCNKIKEKDSNELETEQGGLHGRIWKENGVIIL